MKPLIDVCVCSYKRPAQLEILLSSLVAQETDGRFRVAIHVADNDANGTAGEVVRRFNLAGHAISYGIEPEQNIALARNRSVSFATGEFIATTDDDLHAHPRWLLEMFATAEEHHADAVHGPVVHRFPPNTPAYVRDWVSHANPPTGTTRGYDFTTGNSIFRRALIAGTTEPFNPHFGRTGGEDSDFFNRLRDRNCRMVWCHEAVVFADQPPHRSTLLWMLRRSLRNGSVARDLHYRPMTLRRFATTLRTTARLALTSSFYLLRGAVHPPAREKAAHCFVSILLICSHLTGRLARVFNMRFEEYRGDDH